MVATAVLYPFGSVEDVVANAAREDDIVLARRGRTLVRRGRVDGKG